MTWPVLRGQLLQVEIGLDEPKLVLVVSNNRRNERLGSVLAVRLTTSAKPPLPSIVELDSPERFVGRVVCDDILEVFEDEVLHVRGALSPFTMTAVDDALKAALSLS